MTVGALFQGVVLEDAAAAITTITAQLTRRADAAPSGAAVADGLSSLVANDVAIDARNDGVRAAVTVEVERKLFAIL